MTQYLSIDIGGTNVKYGLFDHSGNILEKGKIKTEKDNLSIFLRNIYQIIDKFEGKYDGIAFCSPGKIDSNHKIIHFGGALPFLDGLNLEKTIGRKYQVPVSVQNDGKAAALAELWLGKLKGSNSGVVLTLGTGVGGGVLIDKKLVLGKDWQAGEFSWMITDKSLGIDDYMTYTAVNCSAVTMIMLINKAIKNSDLTNGLSAFKAIKEKNESAVKIFRNYCRNIAVMILNIQTVINSEKIVIGGGISSQSILIEEIKRQFIELITDNKIIGNQIQSPKIEAAKFKNDANLYGALYNLLLQLDDTDNKGQNKVI